MKLFSASQMSWDEPYFFVLRLRERKAWIWRAVIAIGLAALMFAAIFFFDPRPRGLQQTLLVSLMAGVVLTLLPDALYFQRNISIDEDSIGCFSNGGIMSAHATFPLKDIQQIQLIRPESWGRSCGGMLLQMPDQGFLVAVPPKVELHRVANVLHRLGVSVQLAGWEPSEQDTRIQVKEELDLLPEGAASHDARIWPVEPGEPSLSPPLAMAVAITIAFGPLLLALLSAIGIGVYMFLQWRALSVVERWGWGLGAFGGIVVGFIYLIQAGQFLASRYLVGVGKKMLRMRTQPQLSGEEEDLNPVEIFDRQAWTKSVSNSLESGFLQVDKSRRLLKFEGNKHRWLIPATALTACRIEEAHVGSEGDNNAEKRYFVVIGLNHDGQPWEAGMVRTRTTVGSDGRDQRLARAKALLSELELVLTNRSRG